MQLRLGPAAAFAVQSCQQRGVVSYVEPDKWRDLIKDLVSGATAGTEWCGRGHEVWMPHSLLAVPAQRPLRGSAPSATLEVHVRQPIDG